MAIVVRKKRKDYCLFDWFYWSVKADLELGQLSTKCCDQLVSAWQLTFHCMYLWVIVRKESHSLNFSISESEKEGQKKLDKTRIEKEDLAWNRAYSVDHPRDT